MSSYVTCYVNQILPVPPCTTKDCRYYVPAGKTCLFLQNFVPEPIVVSPLIPDPSNPVCINLPAFVQDPNVSNQVPTPFFFVLDAPQAASWVLTGVNTGAAFGQVTSSLTASLSPTPVNPTPPAPVTPTNLPSTWNLPDVRRKKPLWVLIAAGVLWLAGCILLIVAGTNRNSQVLRVYAELKGFKSEAQIEAIEDNEQLEPEYAEFKQTGLIVLGSIGIVLLAGIVVAMLFLPGYPLSKYMSFEQCYSLAQSDPGNYWGWSVPPEGGFFRFACKALGACICRSFSQETQCFLYSIQNPNFSPNVWQAAKKSPPFPNSCACCESSDNCTRLDAGYPVSCETK